MKHDSKTLPDSSEAAATHGRRSRIVARVVKTAAIVILSCVALVLILLAGVSVWLTPERLTEIVNREASRYLDADIHASNISYTLWKSFPRLDIRTDSITVTSRTLKGVGPEIRRALPSNADFLGSLKSFSGSINIVDLFLNRYVIHDLRIDGLRLNLVAYNDTVNNFDIIPKEAPKLSRIPYFTIKNATLLNPEEISFFSAASDSRASVMLSALSLKRLGRRGENLYRLSLNGKVSASSEGLTILNRFPFAMAGDVRLRFHPFGIDLADYGINLGKLQSKLSMNVGIGDDSPGVNTFDYRISTFNLATLLGYIPKEYLPALQGVEINTPVSLSARLTSSWKFLSDWLPSMQIDFSVPQGTVDYTVDAAGTGAGEERFSLRHSPISGSFVFNGRRPDKSYVKVPRFEVSADGVCLSLDALATDLTTDPLIRAGITVDADIRRALKAIPAAIPLTASGSIDADTRVAFRLSSFSGKGLAEGLLAVRASGDVNAKGLKVESPSLGFNGSLNSLHATLSESAGAMTASAVTNPDTRINLRLSGLRAATTGATFDIDRLSISSSSAVKGTVTPASLKNGMPINVSVRSNRIRYADRKSGIRLDVRGMRASDVVGVGARRALAKALSDGFRIRIDTINASAGNTRYLIQDADLTLSLNQRATPLPYARGNRGLTLATLPDTTAGLVRSNVLPIPEHSPELVMVEIPASLRTFLCDWSAATAFKAKRADIFSPGLKGSNYISGIDFDVADDAVRLHNADILIERTRARVSGEASNLLSFLLMPPSMRNPLNAKARIDLDTVNINSLARAYVDSKGGADKVPRHDTTTADDSVALLVPRNLRIGLTASARETIYTNLHLYNLFTDVNVADGRVHIPNLGISSDFGEAALRLIYDTSDLEDLSLKAKVDISHVNVVNFFKNFKKLLLMMPQMKNLSGVLSAEVALGGKIYPDMNIDMPSATATATVHGRDLKVHQDPFIRRITRMMLIRTSDDIHIKNMNVHARVHDNLLQLDPFNFEFDRYKLRMMGINNFDGDLYYHIAVMKSPVPWPFSVNIEGEFSHPELRFGGAHYNIRRGEEITSQIEDQYDVNLVAVLKKFLRTFICKAAESAEN